VQGGGRGGGPLNSFIITDFVNIDSLNHYQWDGVFGKSSYLPLVQSSSAALLKSVNSPLLIAVSL
jgi:hypothetical protein